MSPAISVSPRRLRPTAPTHGDTLVDLSRRFEGVPPRTGYIASNASYTVTLPPPCRTGEPFARPVAAWSESAWTIV
jgi:hypothetical protein